MESEMFTFVVLSHEGHNAEHVYCNRRDADRRFNTLVDCAKEDNLVCVAYYCASVGGLVNAHYVA